MLGIRARKYTTFNPRLKYTGSTQTALFYILYNNKTYYWKIVPPPTFNIFLEYMKYQSNRTYEKYLFAIGGIVEMADIYHFPGLKVE